MTSGELAYGLVHKMPTRKKLENGESTKEEYDDWRYKCPELDTHQIWAKVPSQEISDMLLAGLKEMEKEEKKQTKRKKKK